MSDAVALVTGLMVEGAPRRPSRDQLQALNEIVDVMGVGDAGARRRLRKELWALARKSIVFRTFHEMAPQPGEVRSYIDAVSKAAADLTAAIYQIEQREACPAQTVALWKIFEADSELYGANGLDQDFTNLLGDLLTLGKATEMASKQTEKGKRPANIPFESMVRDLGAIFKRETGKRATVHWRAIKTTYTGPFLDCVRLLQSIADPTNQRTNLALGEAVKRAMPKKDKKTKRQIELKIQNNMSL